MKVSARPEMTEITEQVTRIWATRSSTDQATTYLTMMGLDGSMACSCPGWAFNGKCWHTTAVVNDSTESG